MITDDLIIKRIKEIPYKKVESIFNRLNDEEQQYIKLRYSDSKSIKETFYRINNNIEIRPVCKHCGNEVEFTRNGFFRNYCCIKCASNDEEFKNKCKETSLKKYGVEYPSSSDSFKSKMKNTLSKKTEEEKKLSNIKRKQTCLKKYGVEYSTQSNIVKEKSKETCLEKYGVENGGGSKESIEKIKNTNFKKYGGWYLGSKEQIKKAKQTKLERYGNPNYTNPDKAKQTKLEKYGDSNYINPNKAKETNIKKYGVKYASQLNEYKEKQKKTCLKKYGVDTYFKTEELKKSNRTPEVNLKRNKTNQQNIKLHKFSKEENICFDKLKEIFPNTIRQYTSKLYPFNCDFYIPELDLYIEYNGSHYHHSHAFNENDNNDIIELKRLKKLEEEKLKEHKNTQYSEIIYTWTDLDIRKRKTAKENNLNFIEFWNIDEVKEWIKNINNINNYE